VTAKWKLLGYDAREAADDPLNLPLPERMRQEFLLRAEILRPLSVDKHIWPSCFAYDRKLSPDDPSSARNIFDEDMAWGGVFLSLPRLARSVEELRKKAVLIAVELLVPEGLPEDRLPPAIYNQPDPDTVPPDALLLGYDVADAGQWSGLSNCGYTVQEVQDLAPRWIPKINDAGLLCAIEDAIEFLQLSNSRVPEHAPFLIYRLAGLNP
jgi:hypothetical protein